MAKLKSLEFLEGLHWQVTKLTPRAQAKTNLGPELNQGLEDRDGRLIKPPIMPDQSLANNECGEENIMDSMGLLDVRDHVVNKCLCVNMSVCVYV